MGLGVNNLLVVGTNKRMHCMLACIEVLSVSFISKYSVIWLCYVTVRFLSFPKVKISKLTGAALLESHFDPLRRNPGNPIKSDGKNDILFSTPLTDIYD